MSSVTSDITTFSMAFIESVPDLPDHGGNQNPTILFIHGTESAKGTWALQFELLKQNYHMVAIDLRGHGDSSLGDPDLFSLERIVLDIHEFVISRGLNDIVLVGHSMGGRVATCYSARYPENIKVLIIEDMEMIPEPTVHFASEELAWKKSFKTDHASLKEAEYELVVQGFHPTKIERLKKLGKIYPIPGTDGAMRIGFNPYVTYLTDNTISASEESRTAFKTLKDTFPVHLFVASYDTCITFEGLEEMRQLNPNLQVTFFNGGHSIHRSAIIEFNDKLKEIFEGL